MRLKRRSESWGYPCRSTILSATVSFREVANGHVFADRLVLVTAAIVILMSLLFALSRAAG